MVQGISAALFEPANLISRFELRRKCFELFLNYTLKVNEKPMVRPFYSFIQTRTCRLMRGDDPSVQDKREILALSSVRHGK